MLFLLSFTTVCLYSRTERCRTKIDFLLSRNNWYNYQRANTPPLTESSPMQCRLNNFDTGTRLIERFIDAKVSSGILTNTELLCAADFHTIQTMQVRSCKHLRHANLNFTCWAVSSTANPPKKWPTGWESSTSNTALNNRLQTHLFPFLVTIKHAPHDLTSSQLTGRAELTNTTVNRTICRFHPEEVLHTQEPPVESVTVSNRLRVASVTPGNYLKNGVGKIADIVRRRFGAIWRTEIRRISRSNVWTCLLVWECSRYYQQSVWGNRRT